MPADVFDATQVLSVSRGNPVRAKALVQQFLAVLPEEHVRIEVAQAVQDLETVRQSAHRLTSGGHNTGVLRISRSAGVVEQRITDGASWQSMAAGIAELVRDIRTVLAQAEAVWLARLES